MKVITRAALVLIGLMMTSATFADKDPLKAAIEARQGEMELRSWFAGPLFAMAKSKIPYDGAKAQALADNLVKLLEIDVSSAWMTGTSIDDYPDESEAKPEIWTTYPEISKYGKEYTEAVNALAEEAGFGLDELKGAVKTLGKSCKGCHDEFREKD